MSTPSPVDVHNKKVWARYIEVLQAEGLDDFHDALICGAFHVSDRLEDFVLLLLDVVACAARAIAFPDGDPVVEGSAEDWDDEPLSCRVTAGGGPSLMPQPANDNADG